MAKLRTSVQKCQDDFFKLCVVLVWVLAIVIQSSLIVGSKDAVRYEDYTDWNVSGRLPVIGAEY